MIQFLRYLWVLVIGFILYPALFVPLMLKYAPQAMDSWVHLYADYLRQIWGF